MRRALARLTTALIPVLALVAPAAPAVADDCPAVELVFARGTNEAPGLGRVGDAVFQDLQGALGGRRASAPTR